MNTKKQILLSFIFSLKAKWAGQILECCNFLWAKTTVDAGIIRESAQVLGVSCGFGKSAFTVDQERRGTCWDLSVYVYFFLFSISWPAFYLHSPTDLANTISYLGPWWATILKCTQPSQHLAQEPWPREPHPWWQRIMTRTLSRITRLLLALLLASQDII